MDKLFKKSFFNDSSRRPGHQEKEKANTPQAPPGSRSSSNNTKQAMANTKMQSRSPSYPAERDSPPQQPPTKTPASSIHTKATPTLPSGQSYQQQQQQPYQSSPYQQQQQQPQSRDHSAEHSNSSLNSNRNSIASSDFSLEDKQQRPPVPKHHPNPSQSSLAGTSTNSNGGGSNTSGGNNGGSNSTTTTTTKSKDKVGKKWEILASQVNTLNESKNKLEQQLKGLRREKDQQCMDLQRQNEELQRMLRFKEDEYTKMQNNFHKHVRTIRATDDDLSTIHSKLTMLQAKASQLPMALRASYQETRSDQVIAFFEKRWPELKGTLAQLLVHDAATGVLTTTTTTPSESKLESKLDYPLVCLLVEKMVMEILVETVFSSPVHLGLSINHHYQALSSFMEQHQANDWANKLRQQLCKLAVNANQEQVGITEAKQHVVQQLKTELDIIYQVPPEKLLPKLNKLVDLASETSLAMHSQDEPVLFGTDLVQGQSMYNPRLMNLQYGSTMVSALPKPIKKSTNENQQQKDGSSDKDRPLDDDDDDDDDDEEDDIVEAPTSPLPTPSLVLRVVICPVVYAGDENGNPTPLLPARVICF